LKIVRYVAVGESLCFKPQNIREKISFGLACLSWALGYLAALRTSPGLLFSEPCKA
jgi:hypothetical protein